MKTLLILCLSLLSSCADSFTRQDALNTGFDLAVASLDIAAKKAAGEEVDLKAEGRKIGAEVVSNISAAMQANLGAANRPIAAASVQLAGEAASLVIREAALDSPEARAAALKIVSTAVRTAEKHFQGAPAAPLSE